MKVVVLGGAGMLGAALCEELAKGHDVLSIGRSNCDYNLDCLDLNPLGTLIHGIKPDVIINCIAIVSLDACEKDKTQALKTHVELSEFVSSLGYYNIYISTDSVYSGDNTCWNEVDQTKPMNFYAQTKLLGEEPVLKNKGLVLRTNIYGYKDDLKGGSLFEWAFKNISAGKDFDGYGNVYFNPVSIFQLSDAVHKFINLDNVIISDVINVGSDSCVSKYAFIKSISDIYNPRSATVNQIDLIDADITRPKNTCLNTKKMSSVLGVSYSLEKGIEQVVNQVTSNL